MGAEKIIEGLGIGCAKETLAKAKIAFLTEFNEIMGLGRGGL